MLRGLLDVKGSPLQEEFLDAARDRRSFLDYMSVLPVEGVQKPLLWDKPISETDFRALPIELELDLYRRWSDIPPDVARRSSFWAYLTCCHIEAGTIDSTHLVATDKLSGGSVIEQALADSAPSRIDACVRMALRRMGGLRPARGRRSVYVDCMFARAWWRERMVEEATSELADGVRVLFRTRGKSLWEDLVSRLIDPKGVSVFGSLDAPSEVRRALILALARHVAGNRESLLAQSHQLWRIFEQAAIYEVTPGLGPATDVELARVVSAIVEARAE